MSTEMNVRSLLDTALATSAEGNSFHSLSHSFIVGVIAYRCCFFLIVKIEQSITVPRRIFFLPSSKSNRKFIKIV